MEARSISRTLIAALTAAALLTGCATTAASPSPSAASSVSVTASPTAPTPQPTAPPTASAAGSASAEDLVAIAKLVYPYDSQYGYYTVCGANGDLSQCPVTDRLKAYLTQKHMTLCDCQNPAPSMDATATSDGSGGVAHVVLGYQQTPMRFDLIVIRDGGRLLVDDQQCTGGGASSSIYVRTGGC